MCGYDTIRKGVIKLFERTEHHILQFFKTLPLFSLRLIGQGLNSGQAWNWYKSVIQLIPETEAGESQAQGHLGNSVRTYLKTTLK